MPLATSQNGLKFYYKSLKIVEKMVVFQHSPPFIHPSATIKPFKNSGLHGEIHIGPAAAGPTISVWFRFCRKINDL